MRHSLRLGTMVALCIAAAATLAASAGAGQVFSETVHEEGVDVVTDF